MKRGIIRPLAICVFRREKAILVAEGYDSVKRDFYYRPIGGGIEYGEKSLDAVKREVYEEIGAGIDNIQYIETVENIFSYNGELGHEIVMVYEAEFSKDHFYKMDTFEGKEDDGSVFKLKWIRIDDFESGSLRLVPDGLLDLIR
ncbi:NUDIX domain-containing protein [Bacillus sp. ISL-35]|uniref:NUDIX hydrolase n=1 Tax=Bacillus sp. ISL-35 TaxID=2819122 RepID=UPI001BE9A4CD|nr:NUDIX domain-containing protein [Chryseobacterium sp. ISL-80]